MQNACIIYIYLIYEFESLRPEIIEKLCYKKFALNGLNESFIRDISKDIKYRATIMDLKLVS